jgi:hypothetical protein
MALQRDISFCVVRYGRLSFPALKQWLARLSEALSITGQPSVVCTELSRRRNGRNDAGRVPGHSYAFSVRAFEVDGRGPRSAAPPVRSDDPLRI